MKKNNKIIHQHFIIIEDHFSAWMKSQTNEEIENKLKVILQNISTGFFSKDSAQVTSNFTLLWNYYYNSNLIKTTKRNNEMILPVLFDMITTYPIFLPKLQSRFCALFCKIIRKPKYIPDNWQVSSSNGC